MTHSRRSVLLGMLGVAGALPRARRAAIAVPPQLEQADATLARIIEQYDSQGEHRTGTRVDAESASWMAARVAALGLSVQTESFEIDRVDPLRCELVIADTRLRGLPLFDGAFTSSGGVSGTLSQPGGSGTIELHATAVNAADRGALGDARRAGAARAIVCVTRGARPGLVPSNADHFLRPFGPPVLQVSSEYAEQLGAAAVRGVAASIFAEVRRERVSALNVTSRIAGREPSLPPVVVMTPRSGWYRCASERGGGLAVWFAILEAMRNSSPRRDVLFVASTGHEIGYLGIDAYIARRPSLVRGAHAWVHLGASIGAAAERRMRLQSSDDELERLLDSQLTANGLSVDFRTPRGAAPVGEALAVHRGGGRFVSLAGSSSYFHHPGDRFPESVSVADVASFAKALTAVVGALAA